MPNFSEVFLEFQECINSDQSTRERVRNCVQAIEQISREIITVLQVIHCQEEQISNACLKARGLFDQVKVEYGNLEKTFPPQEYHKNRDHWRFVTQKLCFSAALIVWLEVGTLISRDTAAAILGIKAADDKTGIYLELEEFLMGLLELSSELARYAVNSATRGEYSRAVQISQFVSELNAGFRLLNLKNDSLRRRFDSLKYDVKKIEEVVYDLSIRGLIPGDLKPSPEDTGDAQVLL